MNRKATIITLTLVLILTLTITTCDLLKKDMELILPVNLYDSDPPMNKEDGIIQIFNYEETEIIIELEIIDDEIDAGELSKILKIPPYAIISANELSAVFTCEAMDTDMNAPDNYIDITIRASALHYNNSRDTVRIHDVTPAPTPKSKITPNPRAEATPLSMKD